jgi:hypothetical protein
MFRETMCSSSGETTISIRHLVLVTLCGWLSAMQGACQTVLLKLFMYFHCYVYVLLVLCMFCSVYSVFIVPTGTLRLFWLRFFLAFPSVVRQMPGYNSQRRGTACTLPKLLVFCVLFVCKCVLYYCHGVATQLQITNISIYIYIYI